MTICPTSNGPQMSRWQSIRRSASGGPAKRMAFPKTREQLVVLMGFLQDAGVKPLLIGNGTNLLVADKGLDTVVIDTSAELSHIELTDEGEIAADAGVSLAKLALFAWKNGLTGLEFAHGIPGTLGGGVVMNAGAYGGELKDVVTEVTALYLDGVKVLTPAELDFFLSPQRVFRGRGHRPRREGQARIG